MPLDNPFFIPTAERERKPESPYTLATVAAVSNGRVSLTLPGASAPTQKYYKILQTAAAPVSLAAGDAVLVLKISGTLLVIGRVPT